MKILALDLATNTGWAVNSDQGLSHGVQNFSLKHYEGDGLRFLRFHNWFLSLLRTHNPELVVFEEVMQHSSNKAARVYCGLLADLQLICEGKSLKYEGFGVGQIKKFATGKGNAKKPQMIDAAKRFGHKPIDDNDADAICLHYLASAQFGGVPHAHQ